jgi:hypothetical protein
MHMAVSNWVASIVWPLGLIATMSSAFSAPTTQQTVFYGGYEQGSSESVAGSFSYDPTQSPYPVLPGTNAYDASQTFYSPESGVVSLSDTALYIPATTAPGQLGLTVYGVQPGVLVGGQSGLGQIEFGLAVSQPIFTPPTNIATAIPQQLAGAPSGVVGAGYAYLYQPSFSELDYNLTAASTSFANVFVFDPNQQQNTRVTRGDTTVSTYGGVTVTTSGPNITASFTPQFGISLAGAASVAGFKGFDWVSQIINLPSPSPYFAAADPCVISHPYSYSVSCASLSTPSSAYPAGIPDPPNGGLTYSNTAGRFPFYWTSSALVAGACLDPSIAAMCPVETAYTLNFFDNPGDLCLPGGSVPLRAAEIAAGILPPSCLLGDASGSQMVFDTELVGISSTNTPIPLGFDFEWETNFNGTAGGTSQLDSVSLIDPGSGTGRVTLLSVDGVAVDTPEPASALIFLTAIVLLLGYYSLSCKIVDGR